MRPLFAIYIMFPLLISVSCSGMREVERKDIFGRVSTLSVYNGTQVEKVNEVIYSDNSFNPAFIRYKMNISGQLAVYKEEEYIYQSNNLKKILFYLYDKKKKVKTGWIEYNYNINNLKNIGYYTVDPKSGNSFMFGLDNYEYNENYKLTSRRFIEYDYQPEKRETTQTAQYVFYYADENLAEMKTWILDKNSKKIIEKKEINQELVNMVLRNIEETCNMKVRGRDFIK